MGIWLACRNEVCSVMGDVFAVLRKERFHSSNLYPTTSTCFALNGTTESKQFARKLCLLDLFAIVLFSYSSFVVRVLFKLNNSDSYVSGDEFVRI